MSKIDEMLKNENVEWKKLGDVCEIKTGKAISKAFIAKNKGDYPVINSGKEPLGYVNTWNIENDPIGITSRGAGVGSITYQEGKYYRGNLNYSVTIKDKTNLNFRFLYHLLLNRQSYIHNLCTYNGIPALNASELKTLELPIPSLNIQEKIEKTLDKFTNYVTELQSELQSRNRQYEYYRDKLLSEEYLNKLCSEVKISNDLKKFSYEKLKDLADIVVGGDVPKSNFSKVKTEKYNVPIFSNGTDENSLYGYTSEAKVLKASVTVSARGTIGYVSIKKEPYYPVVRLLCLIPKKESINLSYLYYFLQQYKFNYVQTGIPSLTSDMIKNIKVPLPNVCIQEKIVEILDKFQAITQDISGSLPDEIEKREKQYEYYREKLLTFDTERTSRGGTNY